MLEKPGLIAWLVIMSWIASSPGLKTSSTAAMATSCGQASRKPISGLSSVRIETTRPMKTGIEASSTAVTEPTTNSAISRPLIWPA